MPGPRGWSYWETLRSFALKQLGQLRYGIRLRYLYKLREDGFFMICFYMFFWGACFLYFNALLLYGFCILGVSYMDKPERTTPFVWRFLADGYRWMLGAAALLKLNLEYMLYNNTWCLPSNREVEHGSSVSKRWSSNLLKTGRIDRQDLSMISWPLWLMRLMKNQFFREHFENDHHKMV